MRIDTGESLKPLHPYTFDTTAFDTFRALYLGKDKGGQFLNVSIEGAHQYLRLPIEIITAISPAEPQIPRWPEAEK